MKKEKSVGKNQIFTVISILCGIGSVIGFWLNAPSELISILLILLCGVFAYFGLRHKSIYIVFAMGIAHCLPTLTLEGSSEDLIGELYISAFAMGCFFAVLGLIGIIAGFLFHYGFAGKAAPAVASKAKRVAAIAGAVLCLSAIPLSIGKTGQEQTNSLRPNIRTEAMNFTTAYTARTALAFTAIVTEKRAFLCSRCIS